MERLTNSNKNIYMECPKKYWYMIENGYRPVKTSDALNFGTEFHRLLEDRMLLGELKSQEIKARILFEEYCKHWESDFQKYKILAVEKEFSLPLINPATGAKSRTFELAGKIDLIVQDLESGDIAVVEHKTTSNDISNPESNYWLALQIDPQITGYFLAAESLGYNPKKIIYDVIGKPNIKPLLATPVEARKHTKEGKLYANQRDTDETPEVFSERLRLAIADEPSRYFQRRDIARIETDIIEYLQDMWAVGKLIMESRNEDFWPRRPKQCFNYGRCAFFDVCAKCAMLEDESLYTKSENKNPELEGELNGF